MAGRDRERRRAALERRDALFEHRAGRIADARVDVAEGLQAEQRRRMIDVVEHERRRLVDRRRPRARRGVGRGAGMDGERGKAGAAGWVIVDSSGLRGVCPLLRRYCSL